MPEPLPLSDPRITGLPAKGHGEPLIDVRGVPALRLAARVAGVHDGYTLLRATVVDRLVLAQSLLPRDLRLLIIEGYRSPEMQQLHLRECQEDLRRGHPDWSSERVREEADWYCAPGGSAPHPTGAAVDVTLCTTSGHELVMGSAVHAGPFESGGACATDAPGICDDAWVNRSMLAHALMGAGMVNLPSAWWHWSYGDRYWCYRTGASTAPYGQIQA